MTKILPQIRLYFSYLMLALAFAFTAMESPIGIAEEASAPAATPEQASPAQAQKININTADAKTLAENMKGIGIKKAQAIIEYREAFGPFLTVEDLASVKGIGEKDYREKCGDSVGRVVQPTEMWASCHKTPPPPCNFA